MISNIRYGYTENDSYLNRMYFSGGDNTNHLGSDGETYLDTTDYVGFTQIHNVQEYQFHYLKCLERVVQPDVKIIAVSSEQWSDVGDWGSSTLQFNRTHDFTHWTPKAGNLGKLGPRGDPFIGGRQSIAATHRYGWMRWHYIAGNYMDLPALFAPEAIDATFASHYTILRNLADPPTNYATFTNALGVQKQITLKSLPGTVLHFGIRNG